jgi:hypothetical protein
MEHARVGKLFLVLLLLATVRSVALPLLEVNLGFSGRFVPGRMTPVRLIVSGVKHPFSGSFRIVQDIGDAWRGKASSLLEIPIPSITDGEYEELLPLYDFTHPLRVSLCTADGTVVATAELILRGRQRGAAFPLVVGASPFPFVPEAVVVAPAELPRYWLAYEGVSTLWIGRVRNGLTTTQWEAITRWTIAGGSLIIFSGADFYPLDSPLLRDLLPISDPSLVKDADGIPALRGEERAGVRCLLERDDGAPLLLLRRYGAGTVLLVTTIAFDLTAGQTTAVAEQVPPAELVSLTDVNADLLEEVTINRPGFPAATLVVALSLISLSVIVSRVRNPERTVIALVVVVALLSLSSGLYLNRAKVANDVYVLKTRLSAGNSLGYIGSQYGFFATRTTPVRYPLEGAVPVLEELPRSLHAGSYDIDWVSGEGLSLRLGRGERRTLRGGGACSLPVSIRFAGDEQVEIENGLDTALHEAYLLVDGEAFPLGEVVTGKRSYTLDRSLPGGEIELRDASLATLYSAIRSRYTTKSGVWLIGGCVSDSLAQHDGVRLKVRDVSLYIIFGGGYG